MSRAPALLAGLGRRGAIAAGRGADLVAFSPDAGFIVDAARLRHRNPLTPYDGHELTGVVRRTWRRGRPVGDGEPRGQLIRRQGTV